MDRLLLTTTTTMITAATITATRIARTTTGVMMFESWSEGVFSVGGASLIDIVRSLVEKILEILFNGQVASNSHVALVDVKWSPELVAAKGVNIL